MTVHARRRENSTAIQYTGHNAREIETFAGQWHGSAEYRYRGIVVRHEYLKPGDWLVCEDGYRYTSFTDNEFQKRFEITSRP